jgi:class 3 adenylate cyclase
LTGAATAVATKSPAVYTPKHLADKILTCRAALEGERKQVTVLFADVKGSMELAEQVDPEEWHAILDRFFVILAEGVHRFEGTVNQYTGDGIMALFGAPIAHEDHARRACWAALHLGDELRRYARELRRERGLSFAVRMGLNSGEVVVGRIGDDLRMDYTAQGHSVGLAQRMEQLAEPGRVYLTEHTAALVQGYFRLEDLGAFEIPGVQAPLRVYELGGVGALRSRLDVSRARGFSRFVGREEEMATLDAALGRALGGTGEVVGVVADAGVGKSRLCFELAERCRARGVRVYETHCVAHGRMIPYLPVLELFRTYFAVTDRDSDDEVRRKVAGTLLLLDPGLGGALPLLFDFMGVPDPARPAPPMEPEARQRQLLGVVKRVVQSRSRQEPALLLWEDMHLGGHALDRRRERAVRRETGGGGDWDADAAARELSARVPGLVDAGVLVPAASAPAARPRRGRRASARPPRDPPLGDGTAGPRARANGREPLLHRRGGAGARRGREPRGHAGCVSARAADRGACHPADGAGVACLPHRPAGRA